MTGVFVRSMPTCAMFVARGTERSTCCCAMAVMMLFTLTASSHPSQISQEETGGAPNVLPK